MYGKISLPMPLYIMLVYRGVLATNGINMRRVHKLSPDHPSTVYIFGPYLNTKAN